MTRKFKDRTVGYFEVDLDDPSTYSHLPRNITELRQLMLSEIGYAHCYMNYWHSDVFGTTGNEQKIRVENLIKKFAENYKKNYNDILWLQEQIFIFQDEIENMC